MIRTGQTFVTEEASVFSAGMDRDSHLQDGAIAQRDQQTGARQDVIRSQAVRRS